MFRTVFVSVLGLCALTACGDSFAQPQDVVRTFFERVAAGDIEAARECVVADERATARIGSDGNLENVFRIGETQVRGDEATVSVFVDQAGKPTKTEWVAVRRDGDWRISVGMTLTRGVTKRVHEAVDELGDDALPSEIEEAMRRAMQAAPSGNE